MTITLTNLTRRMLVFVLKHELYCARRGECACTRRRDGQRLPSSLTLPAGETLTGLSPAILDVVGVRCAKVRVQHVSEEPGGPGGAPPNPAEVTHHGRRASSVKNRRR